MGRQLAIANLEYFNLNLKELLLLKKILYS